MKRILALLLVVLLGIALPALSYTLVTSPLGEVAGWPGMPVLYWTNSAGSPQISNGSEVSAVQAAFDSWRNVTTARVSFKYMGASAASTVGEDGINLITFVDDSVPLGSDVVAATFRFFDLDSAGTEIQESDIALSTSVDWSTSGESGKWDIQGVLTHEAGHFLGLDHAALLSSVMNSYSAPARLDQRILTYDDVAGVSQLYPNTFAVASLGGIAGTVLSGAAPVFGAHVVALDANGTPIVSTLSRLDGSYTLRFLPAGSYRVYAEPLDGPITEQNFGDASGSFYDSLATDFGTTYYGDVTDSAAATSVQVPIGNTAGGADIHVVASSALNLTEPGIFAVRAAIGTHQTLTVGGSGVTTGALFSASSPAITFGTVTYGGSLAADAPSSATLDINISVKTARGPKNIVASGNGASSVLSGALVVVDAQPTVTQVAPSSGSTAGGTITTISGNNFRPGAQVYFNGLPASSIQVLSAATIQATAPSNVAGGGRVLVVNSDGTWAALANAYTYIGAAPRMLSVTPLSGPPTTLVAIDGSGFDPKIQNLDVRFNGKPARIVSASATHLDVVVPYGASTGPVTVAVSGNTATGPSFTVTPLVVSVNGATPTYQLIDATLGTPVALSNNNDATGLVDLPFTFSLFDDIYPAGSKISISTNGWLSLDAVTSSEFQNGPLPGKSVIRPDGSTGAIPSALIAPYFGDLFVRTGLFGGIGRKVSVRTVGVAPNRRFAVEWSDMGVLSNNGKDTGAHLTFEAILYEGTNDIQFIYPALSGSPADGSTATIGMQNSARNKAFQSGYNQAILSEGYAITYRFNGGAYTSAISTTKPFGYRDEGGFSLLTDGSSSDLSVGYAAIQSDTTIASPAGAAVFTYRVNNTVISEAAVPASPARLSWRLYAEVGGRVESGVSIANANNQAANISYYFTDTAGTDFGSGTLQVPANGKIDGFLDRAPFNGGSTIQGTFTLRSDTPVSVVALRGLTNERGEFLFTTVPVQDLSEATSTDAAILPHYADGGGWTTQVLLVNPGDTALTGTIRFTTAAGQSATLTANGQTGSSFDYTVAPRSSVKLVTSGTGASTQSGWIQVLPASSAIRPAAAAIFSRKSGGVTVSEAGVPRIWGNTFRTYVETSGAPGAIGSIQSGLAIANPSTESTDVLLELSGLDGKSLGLSASLTIPGGGQIAQYVDELFASQALPSPLQAVMTIATSSSPLAVIGLRGRYNERGDFLITTMPVTDETWQVVPTPVFFPHLAVGGGYSTQFILFSGATGQATSGTLRFVGPTGALLPLPLR